MDLTETPEEAGFRAGARQWLQTAVAQMPAAPSIDDWPGRRRYDAQWQRRLFDAGYAGLDWPIEGGGRGLSPILHMIFLEECERAGAPYGAANFVGTNHAGPTIIARGTPEQRQRYLPPILRGDEIWSQGFSEPDAGSDLASLRTRAVRDGDHYVVSGQKLWTSHSSVADFCEMVVRTDPEAPKHRGLSWLIVPMHLDGITVQPVRTLMGSSDFAEVFLDDVRVPVANRVGEENDGWAVAMLTLSFERGSAFFGELSNSVVLARRLLHQVAGGPRTAVTAEATAELSQLQAELYGLRALMLQAVSLAAAGEEPGTVASVFKLHFTELRQRLTRLAMRLPGPDSALLGDLPGRDNGYLTLEWLRSLSLTIAGGTSQIQRNIIAERVLGLPR